MIVLRENLSTQSSQPNCYLHYSVLYGYISLYGRMPDHNLHSKATERLNLESIHLTKEFASSIKYEAYWLFCSLSKHSTAIYFQHSSHLALVDTNVKWMLTYLLNTLNRLNCFRISSVISSGQYKQSHPWID